MARADGERVEDFLTRICVGALLAAAIPPLGVFVALLGVHAMLNASNASLRYWWLPLVSAVALLGWALAGLAVAERLSPISVRSGENVDSGVDLAHVVGLVPSRIVFAAALLLVAVSASPLWVALWIPIALMASVSNFGGPFSSIHRSLDGPTRFAAVFALVGVLGAGISLAIPSGNRVMQIASVAALLLAALLLLGRLRQRPMYALLAVLALSAGLLAGLQETFVLGTVLALFVLPCASLLILLARHRLLSDRMARLIQRASLEQAVGHIPPHLPESVVRAGDGFYKFCHPAYRHWKPSLGGDNGYIAWIGEGSEGLVDQPSILLRSSGRDRSDDYLGSGFSQLIVSRLAKRDSEVLRPVLDALRNSWSVKVWTGNRIPIVKMPWEQPYLLVVPLSWDVKVHLPAGSGLHERSGVPCVATATLRITLRPEVLDAARTEGRSEEQRLILQELAWNAHRILPSSYESLMMALNFHLAGVSVEESLVLKEGLQSAGKSELLADLDNEWQLRQIHPLGRLAEARLLSLNVEPYGVPLRALRAEVRNQETAHVGALRKDLRVLEEELHNRIFPPAANVEADIVRNVSGWLDLTELSVKDAGALLHNTLQSMKDASPALAGSWPAIARLADASKREFDGVVEEQFRLTRDAFQSVVDATRESSDKIRT